MSKGIAKLFLQREAAASARLDEGPVRTHCYITYPIPIRTQSEANMREHYMAKHRRKKQQQQALALHLAAAKFPRKPVKRVELVRVGPNNRKLDADNLAGSFKHIQDGIAKWFGVDDGKIEWVYSQRREPEYGIEIVI